MPNIAIMKLSTYHKRVGDDVDWYSHLFDYQDTDILYVSKIFTFKPDIQYLPLKAKIIKGGTGYDIKIKLPKEIDEITDFDYNLYPECDYSVVFTTRGCIRKCKFCVVPQKEGSIHPVKIPNLNPRSKYIKILDNNFFAYKGWRENLEILKSFNLPLDFNQGIDLRILTEEQCKVLQNSKIKCIHCAWDNYKDKNIIIPKLEMLCKYVKPYKITCYVLVGFNSTPEEDLHRVETKRSLNVNPFVMPFNKSDPYQKNFARWVNHKAIFKSCTWEEYQKT
jgi:hypothetical protein